MQVCATADSFGLRAGPNFLVPPVVAGGRLFLLHAAGWQCGGFVPSILYIRGTSARPHSRSSGRRTTHMVRQLILSMREMLAWKSHAPCYSLWKSVHSSWKQSFPHIKPPKVALKVLPLRTWLGRKAGCIAGHAGAHSGLCGHIGWRLPVLHAAVGGAHAAVVGGAVLHPHPRNATGQRNLWHQRRPVHPAGGIFVR